MALTLITSSWLRPTILVATGSQGPGNINPTTPGPYPLSSASLMFSGSSGVFPLFKQGTIDSNSEYDFVFYRFRGFEFNHPKDAALEQINIQYSASRVGGNDSLGNFTIQLERSGGIGGTEKDSIPFGAPNSGSTNELKIVSVTHQNFALGIGGLNATATGYERTMSLSPTIKADWRDARFLDEHTNLLLGMSENGNGSGGSGGIQDNNLHTNDDFPSVAIQIVYALPVKTKISGNAKFKLSGSKKMKIKQGQEK